MLTPATQRFIAQHLGDDVYALSLKAKQYPDVDIRLALQQIEARQRCVKKLPALCADASWVFPPRLSQEQCSSEQTALYKAQIIKNAFDLSENTSGPSTPPLDKGRCPEGGGVEKTTLVDLTGGMGVDTLFCAAQCQSAVYVEQNTELCQLARHNFAGKNIRVVNADSAEYLLGMPPADIILIDPARRDNKGRKVAALQDCTPDITTLWETIQTKCRLCLVKLSSMLDVTEALRQLTGIIQVHYVGAQGECKEVLLVWNKDNNGEATRIVHEPETQDFVFTHAEESNSRYDIADAVGKFLHVPSASMLKAAPFKLLCQRHGVKALASNTHIYTSDTIPEGWHGKSYTVAGVYSMGKNDIKALCTLGAADITVKNAPFTADQLRKRLRLKDGGDNHLFACTLADGAIRIIHCKKNSALNTY